MERENPDASGVRGNQLGGKANYEVFWGETASKPKIEGATPTGRPSSLIDTRVIYCGDCSAVSGGFVPTDFNWIRTV